MGCFSSKEPTFIVTTSGPKKAEWLVDGGGVEESPNSIDGKKKRKGKNTASDSPEAPMKKLNSAGLITANQEEMSGVLRKIESAWTSDMNQVSGDDDQYGVAPRGTIPCGNGMFYAHLQALARQPRHYHLFDPRRRKAYEMETIKSAECVWSSDGEEMWALAGREETALRVLRSMNSEADEFNDSPKTVLTFGTGGLRDSELKNFCEKLLSSVKPSNQQMEVFVLATPLHEFARRYPHCITTADSNPLMGCFEVLPSIIPAQGFAIYLGDFPLFNSNPAGVMDHGIECVLNTDDNQVIPGETFLKASQSGLTFIRPPGADKANRLVNTVNCLHVLRGKNVRILIYDAWGKNSVDAVVLFLVECGMPTARAVELVIAKAKGLEPPSPFLVKAAVQLETRLQSSAKAHRLDLATLFKVRRGLISSIGGAEIGLISSHSGDIQLEEGDEDIEPAPQPDDQKEAKKLSNHVSFR
eukprot:GHVN01081838.1.p1 GENE.GHVN01081838.1~~GHVN01081838.1.p1  ORF type:complete len:470 (-),score=96.37 GHVN01081838.1:271-1680(-)